MKEKRIRLGRLLLYHLPDGMTDPEWRMLAYYHEYLQKNASVADGMGKAGSAASSGRLCGHHGLFMEK